MQEVVESVRWSNIKMEIGGARRKSGGYGEKQLKRKLVKLERESGGERGSANVERPMRGEELGICTVY